MGPQPADLIPPLLLAMAWAVVAVCVQDTHHQVRIYCANFVIEITVICLIEKNKYAQIFMVLSGVTKWALTIKSCFIMELNAHAHVII